LNSGNAFRNSVPRTFRASVVDRIRLADRDLYLAVEDPTEISA
jgi:hypothetical protein